ncbi:hypothetical protein [Salipiger sp. PrR002]|uniref:hypothetical protein n=1 Tax=Salipiger sp. PrR002 TaxID=2706489 RepID=UPI0013BA1FD0|nr:hypothetical protein [Salipiger sp. PrR002]NDW01915.1 hypothetical protein [Salipiger sp. PrR002]NDW59007.1 hypothetical protein [Salipiger sp. PrR004]
MKTLIASALVATAALTGAASAATATAAPAQKELQQLVPGANLSGLSDAEIISVVQTVNDLDNPSQKAGIAKALIETLN